MSTYANLATVVLTSSDLEAGKLALSSNWYAKARFERIILWFITSLCRHSNSMM